ncbi:MAG: serine/threonine-protein kinase PknK, partial [Acidobacteria bacterium]|nr:serine/threonine-protein kinase PknK [Acidobacteriota bacterium]
DLALAESHIKAALHSASRRGDSINQVLCLTYLAIICRKRGQVEEARSYILPALEAATAGQMVIYIGMAKANLAWMAWHQGNYREVKELGQAAVELWGQNQASYPFQWAALWPLVGVTMAENNISEAIEYARVLLVDSQQRLPDELAGLVEDALNAWSQDQSDLTRRQLTEALKLAHATGYL